MIDRTSSRRFVNVLVLAVSCSCFATLVHAEPPPAPEKSMSACTEVRTEVVYENLGYTHTVILTNHCGKPLVCTITTTSNPEPILANLTPEETHAVVAFRGSPAREFSATVNCKKR